jgi:hypothetical protein
MRRTDARGLAVDLNRIYERETELKRLCAHSYYDGEDADFFQIGRRVAVPEGFVESGRYRYVSDGVVGALCEGEKSFVADRLGELADEGEVPTVEAGEDGLERARREVEDADTVLVPRNEAGDGTVSGWDEEERLSGIGEDIYLDGDDGGDGGFWVRRHGGDSAFVVRSEGIGVVQKKGGDTEAPGFIDPGYDGVNDGRDVGVYLGEGADGYVDFVYRVIVSAPVVEDGGACRVRL